MSRSVTITFDADDPQALAEFWGLALGYVEQPPPPGFDTWDDFVSANNFPADGRDNIAAVVDPEGNGPRLLFLKVPEGKSAKNRVHLDVHSVESRDTPRDEHLAAIRTIVDGLVAAGATEHDSFDQFGSLWTVLTDPEGNEFCVV